MPIYFDLYIKIRLIYLKLIKDLDSIFNFHNRKEETFFNLKHTLSHMRFIKMYFLNYIANFAH